MEPSLDVSQGGAPRGDPTPALTSATPADELGALVSWGAALFYLAESGVNPAVNDYWDALHYVATSLSVGYANIFPVTALGKTVGSVLMMVGPALSARVLDGSQENTAAQSAAERGRVVERLDAILHELQQKQSSS